MKKYRIGLVGCGGIARAHTEGYRAIAGDICEVVAGCDINKENLDKYCEKYIDCLHDRFMVNVILQYIAQSINAMRYRKKK